MTSNKNKYFSNPYLINAAINAITLLESENDVFPRNSVIAQRMSEIAGELRNAVIETDTEKSAEKINTQAKIDKQYWDEQAKECQT